MATGTADTMDDIETGEGRLAALGELYKQLQQVVEERGAAYGDDPCGRTGLYEREFKIMGNRETPVLVEQYSLDRRTIRVLMKIGKSMMIEERRLKKQRETPGWVSLEETVKLLDAGRERVVVAKRERDARRAAESQIGSH